MNSGGHPRQLGWRNVEKQQVDFLARGARKCRLARPSCGGSSQMPADQTCPAIHTSASDRSAGQMQCLGKEDQADVERRGRRGRVRCGAVQPGWWGGRAGEPARRELRRHRRRERLRPGRRKEEGGDGEARANPSGATRSAPRVVGCFPDRVYAATWYSAVRATLSGGRERRERRSRAPSPRVGPPLPRPPNGARTFGSCRRCIVLQICVNGRALSQLSKCEGMRSHELRERGTHSYSEPRCESSSTESLTEHKDGADAARPGKVLPEERETRARGRDDGPKLGARSARRGKPLPLSLVFVVAMAIAPRCVSCLLCLM